ncbi:unnamed protein product [Adineta ricciae]|uniref:Uncharacterized protein n=1 Tax=Adineta ricciae TaxID=249248 RepID=A0A813XGA8_ADIRI|nr:unnamed protein product [Adineta ricciae]
MDNLCNNHPDHLLNLFVHIYGFEVIATRTTRNYSQWLLKSYKCQLLISSVSSVQLNDVTAYKNDDYDILTSIIHREDTRDFIFNRDTVFNVSLLVNSISSILDNTNDIQSY